MLTVNCCFCASRKVLSLRNEKEVGALNHIEPKQERVQAPLMPEPACGNWSRYLDSEPEQPEAPKFNRRVSERREKKGKAG